jgi:ABC-type Fe3+/spermidine/putrescine transport system ATPase subunit
MLQVQNLSFAYDEQKVLHSINFEVQRGQIFALTGKSGSGKSTLLSLIYGFLEPEKGQSLWNNTIIKPPSKSLVPGQKGINILNQEFDLMPYTSVASNVKKKLSRAEPDYNDKRCDELLDVVGLLPFKNQLVKKLSGGQKKRVSIAKTLADDPELLLLDEPFNYIDHQLKDELRRRFFNHIKDQNITCLFVSHEKEEFLAFADEILVLSDQHIIRSGSPENIYEYPIYATVAQLFDDVNILEFEQDQQIAVYPHELKISTENNTDIIVKLKESYYRGVDYLNKAYSSKNHQPIFFTSDKSLQKNSNYHLKIVSQKAIKRNVV